MSNKSDNKPVAWQWLDTSHFRKKIPASAMNPADWRPLYAAPVAQQTPAAWLYTLEYGNNVVDRRVSADRLRYPFGVCGADYLRANDDGVSYVRETPLGVIANGIGQGEDDA